MLTQFRNRFGGWKLLANAVRPLLERAPELGGQHAQLEALIVEADGLVNQQEEMRASLRQSTHRRQEVEREGEELLLRMTAALQNRFGFKSDELLAYGIAPRQNRGRRSKAQAQLERLMAFLTQQGIAIPAEIAAGTLGAISPAPAASPQPGFLPSEK
jgi:hypothetical protein